ncbi:MAG: HD domain-containing protein [Gemmatimonadales bacterium]|jgi:(p)ppGpp synthase/HD superfamily hydrolase|nr:HD domain-containing protein [Gemmatimonadales bacterium]
MHGYSDRLHHAFSFAAKYYAPRAPRSGSSEFIAHPGNLAVILARYGADLATVEAGVLHLVLEESGGARADLEHKIGQKFGPVVLAIARDAVEPRHDERGVERPWRAVKLDYLAHLAHAEPRAVDICVADEIHTSGVTLTALRRLGAEYVRTVASASSSQMIWWYRSLLEVLDDRPDWPRTEMLEELRMLSTDLVRALRAHED